MWNEAEIIKKCCKQDNIAQKLLYEKYASVMYAICLRYAYNKPEAEDILQEGFLKVFSNINDFNGQGSFEGWLKRIFINTAITHYHRNRKHNFQNGFDEIHESQVSDFSFETAEFTQDELLNVIQDLPDGYRIVFNLYAIEGYKHKEIAEILAIDIGTSKSQYSRAKAMIREKLDKMKKISNANFNYNESEK